MARPLQPCGTVAAYNRHLRYGQPACRPCKDAMNDYQRQRRSADRTEVIRLLDEMIAVLARALGYPERAS